MTVISVVDFHIKPPMIEEALRSLGEALADTRAFEGCIGLDVVQDVDDPSHVQLIERWTSVHHNTAYRDWRHGAGASNALSPFVEGAVTVTISKVRPVV
jgi:quinol monooxygenase YgiN